MFEARCDFQAKYPEESRGRGARTEDDFQWVIEFLPLQALMDICGDEDHGNRPFGWWQPENEAVLERSPFHTCLRVSLLLDFFAANDPFNESEAYKKLEKCDPGLKKVKAITIMTQSVPGYPSISPRYEWKDPDFLKRWVDLNAVPKLNRIPEAVAEEAFYVARDTEYVRLWMLFFKEGQSPKSFQLQRLLAINDQRKAEANAESEAEMKWNDTASAATGDEKKAKAKAGQSKWRRFLCSS